ncbi:MAG TPA: SusC/RagA family TonB-linked outer membrane protein [Pedobacter sp.]|uniref:SusC/RagA family TonB-linked outer membrane protein n=1 Tax=Pedobacter sp. TaxID=1411316 RepID=UPI002C3FA906|nr:SusC/RagA family TonB-linked outer membrane protein [Pedobacter sp.]HMI02814.1 SusC/RagA family TonB-linked outer membrane protein [Pedobacter sp.]
MRFVFFLWLCSFVLSGLGSGLAYGIENKALRYSKLSPQEIGKQDTSAVDTSLSDSLDRDTLRATRKAIHIGRFNNTTIKSDKVSLFPGVSLQQYIKGQAAGIYVQEPNGEPGTEQNIFMHGTSVPLLSAKDLFASQPLIVLDGVPLISKEHPFVYDIQQYDFNRIGPATNLLAGIDPDNIASITVMNDLSEAAIYGPRAANGVIYIRTKNPQLKKQVSFNSYIGLATHNSIETINGASEYNFRKPFYNQFGTLEDSQNIPAYLRDSLYSIYYGPSNWTDLYYRNSLEYSANASITGGSERANFRASLGNQRNNGVADGTGISRYSVAFTILMKPIKWLSIITSINGNQLVRDRNRYQRDRFAEERYFPDLSNPISPNKDFYANYLGEYDKSFDDNKTNVLNGYVNLGFTFGKLKINSRFSADYNEGYRDIFYPSTLLETNSYVSNYFGYNQRMVAENTLSYKLDWNQIHALDLEAGQSFQWDTYHYNYGYAYRGSSDYIKINLLDDPKNPLTAYFSNQPNTGFLNTLMYRFLDNVQNNLVSFYGKGTYSFKDKYSLSVMLRTDGSSGAQPTSRWFFSPIVSAAWDIKNDLLDPGSKISELKLHATYGRVGRLQLDDRYAAGPQYTVDIGYTGEPRLGTFSGVAPLNRPYTQGWVGYDIPWAYSEQFNAGLNIGVWNNRVNIFADVYSKADKDQLMGIPAFAEYGYAQAYESGLVVNNSGIDATINADILAGKDRLQWTSSLNVNYNRNKLKALPGGLTELVVGNRLLQVGKSVDQYWLLQNDGIYTASSEIPVNPNTNLPLNFQGIPLNNGDAKWKDQNGDYTIDDKDRKLVGHSLPLVSGGFNNDFRYSNWSLGLNFYYNLGRDIINQDMSRRFDFINQQSTNDITSVKEVTFWEKRGDYNKYPMYNPWSSVVPYRADQDLFLENASFLKLRSVSLGYDLTGFLKSRKSKINKLFIYATVNNVFTITSYTGRDPELTDYTGYDTGYGLPIPRTFTLGVKMDL